MSKTSFKPDLFEESSTTGSPLSGGDEGFAGSCVGRKTSFIKSKVGSSKEDAAKRLGSLGLSVNK